MVLLSFFCYFSAIFPTAGRLGAACHGTCCTPIDISNEDHRKYEIILFYNQGAIAKFLQPGSRIYPGFSAGLAVIILSEPFCCLCYSRWSYVDLYVVRDILSG